MVQIIADLQEKNSSVISSLIGKGFSVSIEHLKVADYLIGDIAVERKTVNDFVSSMLNKRLLRQLEEIKQYKKRLLVIEGIHENELYADGREGIHANAVRGMLLSCIFDYEVPIIMTKTADAAETIKSKPNIKAAVQKSDPKATKQISSAVDIKTLLEAGAHFGHKASRWHPKMAPYIHSKREGSHIIDLTQTVPALENALKFLEETTAGGKQILLVGSKRQAKDVVNKLASDTSMPFVTERWVGGMLTNQKTIGGRIKQLKDLEAKMESGQLATKYNKLEIQRFQEEIDDMNHMYGGIKNMVVKPGAIFIVDIVYEHNALKEARKLGIKTVAVVDTNADPSLVDYPIPANDDAIKTIQLIADYVGQAVMVGKGKQKTTKTDKTESTNKEEEE